MSIDETILNHRLKVENERKAQFFDTKFEEQFKMLAVEYARLYKITDVAMLDLTDREAIFSRKGASISLLDYATTTIEASIDLLRRGYRNQVGMLARSAVEFIATAICITRDPAVWEEIQGGKFKSSKAISRAKDFFPLLGHWYGELCEFTHLTEDDFRWDHMVSDKHDDITEDYLMLPKMNLVLANMAAEFILYDQMDSHRFWHRIAPGKYQFELSPTDKEWLHQLLAPDITEVELLDQV